jgi:hypothetical protein
MTRLRLAWDTGREALTLGIFRFARRSRGALTLLALAGLLFCAVTGRPRLPYSVPLPFEPRSHATRLVLPDPWTIIDASAPFKKNKVLTAAVDGDGGSASVFWAQGARGERPVVVFFIAAGFSDFSPYQSWFEHLAQRGFVVFVPRLLMSLPSAKAPRDLSLENGPAQAWRQYLQTCDASPSVRPGSAPTAPPCPSPSKLAVFGHAEGAVLGANWAAAAPQLGLPQPQALLLMSPEGRWSAAGRAEGGLAKADWRKIPGSTALLLTTAASSDSLQVARELWAASAQIPASRRNWVVYHSDAHGVPALVADSLSPTSLPREDNLDYYGYWKLGDAMLDDVWSDGLNHDAAFGGGPRQRFLGVWSDGRMVIEPDVIIPLAPSGFGGHRSAVSGQGGFGSAP